ncbi:MAG: nitroreductase family protein [Proteobacteria bacterium]|nr:nitroreductase family protein [Pseudomonadota bacterium]MBU1389028.1 nitroreductase family protein [Pseudomonadota bacterium]MBU1543580.1 nitroreductase family protein [Pseudomonadota bacterium]MBU2429681.1 nitroreductase family protein [Pseudomonadota bacterium]MBU2481440.1 nitroreductase family protein [Pseudomonadota bacterium]
MNFEQIAKKRRAINFFDEKKQVSEEQLKQLVELAAKTPSSFNLQPWNLMVLKSPEEKQKLKPLAWDQPKVVEAPVVLIVLADKATSSKGHPVFEKNWDQMLASKAMKAEQREWFENATQSLYNWSPDANLAFAVKNAGFFAMSLMYAATSLGLESHPMDGFDHEAVRREFKIPDNFWIPALLAVGYKKPDMELAPPKWRKTYDEILISF